MEKFILFNPHFGNQNQNYFYNSLGPQYQELGGAFSSRTRTFALEEGGDVAGRSEWSEYPAEECQGS